MRFLLHDAENQVWIDAILRPVLPNQAVNPGIARSPAPLFSRRRVGFSERFQLFLLNALDTKHLPRIPSHCPLRPGLRR